MAIYNNFKYSGYGINQPLQPIFPAPIIALRAPTSNDIGFPIGQEWVYNNAVYFLTSVLAGAATWILVESSGGTGSFTSLTVNPGPTSLSTSGNGAVSVGNSSNTGAITFDVGSGNMAINGHGNVISIGADSAANAVNIGTTHNAAVLFLDGGNGTGVGTAAINMVTAAGGDIVIGAATHTGTIYLGASTAGDTVNIANAVNTGAQVVNIASGASGANSTVNVLTGVASAGTQVFNCLTGLLSEAGAVNIATGTAAHVVTIGSVTGAASTTLQAGTGGLIFSPTSGNASMVPATSSGASTSPTLNARVGRVTVTGLTTASAGTQAITITNNTVTTSSCVLVSIYNLDASGNHAGLALYKTVVAANTLTVTYINNGAGALGAGDNVVISFWVLS